MTVTEATTRTLDAPGATITYDVRPGGDGSQPPLMLIGVTDGRGRLRHASPATSRIGPW